jgi:hypothetical protein
MNEFSLDGVDTSLVSSLIDGTEIKKLYLSHISNITDGVVNVSSPLIQYSVKATIMLKDIHPLFEVIPISKSLTLTMMMNSNDFLCDDIVENQDINELK